MGVLVGQLPVHLLGGDMLGFEKGGQNMFPLAGQFELVLGEMIFEGIQFFRVLAHTRPHIKDQSEGRVKGGLAGPRLKG